MLEALQHPGLLFEALTLRLGQLAILHMGEGKRKKKGAGINGFVLKRK